jgi:hypothetical protein
MAKKSQIQIFRDAARRLEADESEEGFDKALGVIARHKPRSSQPGTHKPTASAQAPKSDREK